MLWVYAPNVDKVGMKTQPTGCMYPGERYVDITGVDWYTSGNFDVNDKGSLDQLVETKKPISITEMGPGRALLNKSGKGYDYDCENILNDLKKLVGLGYDISYFLTWTGTSSYYSFEKSEVLVSDDLILTLDNMASIWKV